MSLTVTHIMHFADETNFAVFSGAENHLFTLVNAQIKSGLTVKMIMIVLKDGKRIRDKVDELRASGVVVDFVHLASHKNHVRRQLNKIYAITDLVRILKTRKQEIVHVHLAVAEFYGRIAALLAGVRYIVESVHNQDRRFLTVRYRFIYFPFFKSVTKHFIAITNAVAAELQEKHKVRNCSVIHYGIPPFPPKDPSVIRKQLGLPEDGFILGFVGRLTEQKNIPVLLRSMVGAPSVHLALVGHGELRGKLEQQAADLGLTNVSFLGNQPDAATLMPAFDALVLPSSWEGFGLVLLEAMLQRVPIIASDTPAIKEVLANGTLGLIHNVGDQKKLTNDILRIKDDTKMAKDLAETAFRYAQQHYTISSMCKKTSLVYQSILQNNN